MPENRHCDDASRFTDDREVSDWAAEAVRWANHTGIISGYPDGSFNPHGNASRAEAAQMIQGILRDSFIEELFHD